MKKIFKNILRILIIFIISLLLLELIKNSTIAAESENFNINSLKEMKSEELEKYIGTWMNNIEKYKFIGVIDLHKNIGVGYTYTNTGGYSQLTGTDKNYAIASYLANCKSGDALQKKWKDIFESMKKLMSRGVISEFEKFSKAGDATREYEEAKAYAKFCEDIINSGKPIDAENNGGKVPVNGSKIGPIKLTKLVKDNIANTELKKYECTDGTKNRIEIEVNIKGEGKKTYTYDVITGKGSGNGIKIEGSIKANSSFNIIITNGKSYTSKDIESVKINNRYQFYNARVFLYGNEKGGKGNPQIEKGPLKSSRRSIFRLWIR